MGSTRFSYYIDSQYIIGQRVSIYGYRLLPPMKLRSNDVEGTSLSETGVK